MPTIRAALVGVGFRPKGTKEIVANLTLGEALDLEREPENAFDPNAIKVFECNGHHIGYIQRDVAEVLAQAMDSGHVPRVALRELPDRGNPILEIRY
jgi:hypothetical protein